MQEQDRSVTPLLPWKPSANPDLLLQVEQYGLETGQDPDDCLNEAISDWLEVRAEPRLESLRKSLASNLVLMPARARSR